MFEEIEEQVIPIKDRKKLLEEIRNENCRQIIITQINIKLFEREQLKNPENEQIQKSIKQNNIGLRQLITGLELIDDELDKEVTE